MPGHKSHGNEHRVAGIIVVINTAALIGFRCTGAQSGIACSVDEGLSEARRWVTIAIIA